MTEEALLSRWRECSSLPHGKEQIDAYAELIQQADLIQAHGLQMSLRRAYASELMGYGDAGKAFPTVVEYLTLREKEAQTVEAIGDTELIFMADFGLELLNYLPQITLQQAEAMMKQFEQMLRFQGWGMRLYYQRAFRFYGNINTLKALEQFQLFKSTRRDFFSDCKACEQADMVRLFFQMGDLARAAELAGPIWDGVLKCHEVPRIVWLLYLQQALDLGDRVRAASLAESLYTASAPEDPSDWGYLGAVLRCWAFTAPERGADLLRRCLSHGVQLWDRDKWFSFTVGAWTFCRKKAEETDKLRLALPRDFPLWREEGIYPPVELGDWFYRQAADTAARFDDRNGTDCYARTLERAVCSVDYIEGQRFWLVC